MDKLKNASIQLNLKLFQKSPFSATTALNKGSKRKWLSERELQRGMSKTPYRYLAATGYSSVILKEKLKIYIYDAKSHSIQNLYCSFLVKIYWLNSLPEMIRNLKRKYTGTTAITGCGVPFQDVFNKTK